MMVVIATITTVTTCPLLEAYLHVISRMATLQEMMGLLLSRRQGYRSSEMSSGMTRDPKPTTCLFGIPLGQKLATHFSSLCVSSVLRIQPRHATYTDSTS